MREYLQAVHTNAHLLLELLNDILDLSRLEAGKLALQCEPFRLARSDRRTQSHVRLSRRRESSCGLLPTSRTRCPTRCIGDSLRLRQVLMNLLSNAIKFTEEGSVTLDVEVESQFSGEIWLRFTVLDTGIGISTARSGADLRAVYASRRLDARACTVARGWA